MEFRKAKTDIDIDLKNRDDVLNVIKCVRSTEVIVDNILTPHKTGIHLDNIPVDPCTGYASIPYKEAEALGYQKIDLLNVSAYDNVRDREHLKVLSNTEPNWELFLYPEVCEQLFQLKNYCSLLNVWKPSSIDELAMILAMIRPGKRNCQTLYNWDEVREQIWEYSTVATDGNGKKLNYFKKPHAYSYSLLIIVQLNALVEKLTSSS